MGADAGKVGLMKKSMYGTRDAASNSERDWQGHMQKMWIPIGTQLKEFVPPQRRSSIRIDTW